MKRYLDVYESLKELEKNIRQGEVDLQATAAELHIIYEIPKPSEYLRSLLEEGSELAEKLKGDIKLLIEDILAEEIIRLKLMLSDKVEQEVLNILRELRGNVSVEEVSVDE